MHWCWAGIPDKECCSRSSHLLLLTPKTDQANKSRKRLQLYSLLNVYRRCASSLRNQLVDKSKMRPVKYFLAGWSLISVSLSANRALVITKIVFRKPRKLEQPGLTQKKDQLKKTESTLWCLFVCWRILFHQKLEQRQCNGRCVHLLRRRWHAMRKTAGRTNLGLWQGLLASLDLDPCYSPQQPLHQQHNATLNYSSNKQ